MENKARGSTAAQPVQQPPPKKKGLARLIAATRYSFFGLQAAFRSEEAFRLEVCIFIVFTPVALWLGADAVEKILLIGSMVLVILVELLNTAVEKLVDRVSLEYHDLSRQAKDIGSAAVFISMLLVAFVWSLILLPRL